MEGGNVRVRRRPGRLEGQAWGRIFTTTQYAAFRSFLKDTIYDATSRFRMSVSFNGTTFEERTVQIQPGTVKVTHGDAGIKVVFSLWVFPASVVS